VAKSALFRLGYSMPSWSLEANFPHSQGRID
jgi:hypothetical protein